MATLTLEGNDRQRGAFSSAGLAGIFEGAAETQTSDAFEVPKVPRYQFQIVVKRGRRNLKISIRQRLARCLEPSADLTEDTGRSDVVGQDRDRRKDALFNVL